MKKLYILIAIIILITSCSQDTGASMDSPIKGVWEYSLSGGIQTLEFGNKYVKYTSYFSYYNSEGTYFGTYVLNENIITLKFNRLEYTKTTHPKVEYLKPEQLPTEAELCNGNIIIYQTNSFKRK